MKVFQKGFNFSQDGPGNRLVYHLSGCNMRCIWCSNPEGMDGKTGADRTAYDILAECKSCIPMFFGGGGVTFTGGEATLQKEELITLLKLLKESGIHTCIETNATSASLAEISSCTDYLIMDFKHHDSEILKRYTGVGNEVIEKNFETLAKTRSQLHVRIPLINGINTDSPEAFAQYFAKHATENTVFEFLAYHEYGKEKWQTEYKVQNGFVKEETLNLFEETFKKYKLNLIKT